VVKNKILYIIALVGYIMAFSFLMLTITGCVSYPDRKNYTFQECYLSDVCRYYSAKSDGKIDCALEAANCRKVRIMHNCNNSQFRPEGVSFQSCWDKLD
jgi:hypothetical protein